MPYSFGGFMPSVAVNRVRSNLGDPEEYRDDERYDDEDYESDETPAPSGDRDPTRKSEKHHGQSKKTARTIVHTHYHDGRGKHHHSHEGHGHHQHKHAGHAEHEHGHYGHAKHEHKHSGHSEQFHRHKGDADHHHRHYGGGKHEHRHYGHGAHEHRHGGFAEHGHEHFGSAEHKHRHHGEGGHEHRHYGYGIHKHEHEGHADHGHRHSGQGYLQHDHRGSGYHSHKHRGFGQNGHEHFGSAIGDHKHLSSGRFDREHKSGSHREQIKRPGQFDFDGKDFPGFDFNGFSSSFDFPDAAPSHPDIVFHGTDPDLYNYYVQKKESTKRSRSRDSNKNRRMDEEVAPEDDALEYEESARTYKYPRRYQKKEVLPHEALSEYVGDSRNASRITQRDSVPITIYVTDEPRYTAPRYTALRNVILSDGPSSYTRPRKTVPINDEPDYSEPQKNIVISKEVGYTAPKKISVTNDQPSYIEPRKKIIIPDSSFRDSDNNYESDTDDQPADQYVTKDYYSKDQVYRMHGASYEEAAAASRANRPLGYRRPAAQTEQQTDLQTELQTELQTSPPAEYRQLDDSLQLPVIRSKHYRIGKASPRQNTILHDEKPIDVMKTPSSILRSLDKEGFAPGKGDKPHLIQYNVVHTDSELPSMSYFSQLRAIT